MNEHWSLVWKLVLVDEHWSLALVGEYWRLVQVAAATEERYVIVNALFL